ncbi:MAG TPA: DinB family protein [Actinomycetota bacterium]|nr:DinB family protein [Actinomycetota bacterium]
MTPGPPSPDPVAEPAAYQRLLLDLLGEDDPGSVQAEAVGAWRALVMEAGDDVSTRPEPTEWSVLECLGHACDAELVTSGRYRWAIAQDVPPLVGYDQDLWVERLEHAHDDPAELLDLFGALRGANLSLWVRTTPERRARVGMHAERGPESVDLMFRLLAGHDRFHLAQARRALDAVRA